MATPLLSSETSVDRAKRIINLVLHKIRRNFFGKLQATISPLLLPIMR